MPPHRYRPERPADPRMYLPQFVVISAHRAVVLAVVGRDPALVFVEAGQRARQFGFALDANARIAIVHATDEVAALGAAGDGLRAQAAVDLYQLDLVGGEEDAGE